DLDLEADLGIDSIKRIEILGTLGTRLELVPASGGKRSEMIEALARLKTLRAIAGWIDDQLAKTTPAAPKPEPQPQPQPEPDLLRPLDRYTLSIEPIGPARPNGLTLADRRIVVSDDGR